MGVIKAAQAPVSAAVFSMKDIEAAARMILLRARHKAEEIIAAAQTESERVRHEAKGEGFAEGRKQGLAQGMEEGKKSGHAAALAEHGAAMGQLIKSLSETVRKLDESRDDLETRGLREVVKLSCGIARRVTKRQGKLDEEVMCANLREAMGLAVHAADVRIAVHPSQLKTLTAELPNLRLEWPQLKHVELAEEGSISPGGVRIFTTHGQVDGDLDVQLDRIVSELMPEGAGETP